MILHRRAHTHTHTQTQDAIRDDATLYTTLHHARQPNLSTDRQTSQHSTQAWLSLHRDKLCQGSSNLSVVRKRDLEICADRVFTSCPSSSVQSSRPPEFHMDNSILFCIRAGSKSRKQYCKKLNRTFSSAGQCSGQPLSRTEGGLWWASSLCVCKLGMKAVYMMS